jgi:nitrous oxide reductase
LYGSHQLLAYTDEVNLLGVGVRTVKDNAESSVVVSKKIGLEINSERTKYLVFSRDWKAGRKGRGNIGNS